MSAEPIDTPADVTQWLQSLAEGQAGVSSQLFERLYDDLRRVARSHLRREDAGHTLSATALVHESWFRLAGQDRTAWQNRGHFLAVASTMMRRILVNHERARRADKRDVECVSLTLSGAHEVAADAPAADIVALHDALLAFEAIDPRAAKVVELRYFGGLENDELAEALGVSPATVKRDWAIARAWLERALHAG
jgi:RNA polymerase sigma factor (TIGR02999 family)